jgi:tRNA (guanine-N7-)-methyltransferase
MEPDSFIISIAGSTESLLPAQIFPSLRPFNVDVGCGKGRFLLAKATVNPDINFLGIDRRLKRVQKVDRKLGRAGLRNVRLICMDAFRVIELLPPASVSTFFIFFPDPWPKRRHHERRLFSRPFLDAIHRTLLPEGVIHTATDHPDYFSKICGALRGDLRFGEVPPYEFTEEDRTEFHIVFTGLNAQIGRCSFRKIGDPPQPCR